MNLKNGIFVRRHNKETWQLFVVPDRKMSNRALMNHYKMYFAYCNYKLKILCKKPGNRWKTMSGKFIKVITNESQLPKDYNL